LRKIRGWECSKKKERGTRNLNGKVQQKQPEAMRTKKGKAIKSVERQSKLREYIGQKNESYLSE